MRTLLDTVFEEAEIEIRAYPRMPGQTLGAMGEEEEFRVGNLPRKARDWFFREPVFWPSAVQEAIKGGNRNLNDLTNIAFYMHHRERLSNGVGRPLRPTEPDFKKLAEEWKGFRTLVKPLLQRASPSPSPATPRPAGRIEDRTAFSPRSKRKKVRHVKDVYALVLHQTAFSRGNNPTRYDRVTAHYVILPNGHILQLHPVSAYLWSSNGFNPGSVAVEFVGNFPNTRGKCWKASKFGCHRLSPEQIQAGRFLVKHLIDTIGLTHILAHRQSSGTRGNDPGPDIWCQVGQWAIKTRGLRDGGPGFKVGSGQPIPAQWRNWC